MRPNKSKWRHYCPLTSLKEKNYKDFYNKNKVNYNNWKSGKNSFNSKMKELIVSTYDGKKDMSGSKNKNKTVKEIMKKKKPHLFLSLFNTKTKTTKEYTWIAKQKQTKQ